MSSAMPMFPTFLDAGDKMTGTTPSEVFLKHHEALEEQAVACSTHRADTLSRLVDLLAEDEDEDDYGPTSPTRHAFKVAFWLVRGAHRLTALRISGSPSVDSLGGIRLTWKYADRELRLVCPSSRAEQAYLYKQSEFRNSAIHGVTSPILAEELSWLVRGDTL